MKRVAATITFFVLIISIFFIKIQADSYSPEKVLVKAFDSSGAKMAGTELYLRGRLNGSDGTGIEYEKHLMGEVLSSLGFKGPEPVYNTIDNDRCRGIELDYGSDSSASLRASIINDKSDSSGGSYFSISLISTSGERDLPGLRNALEKTLSRHGITAKYNSCITGCFEGKKGYNELNAACARIFASAGAKKVEGIREGGLVSVSAFSGAIRESVNDNGNRVNLNLAIRYNSYENRTYLWLATPVITTEY